MPAWITDVNALFASTFQDVTGFRVNLGLIPLQPSGQTSFQIGEEFLKQQDSPPRIVIVPRRTEFDFSQYCPPVAGITAAPSPSIYRQWLIFEAHIWGDPDSSRVSTTVQPFYDFNSTIELQREFLWSMYTQCTGGSFRPDGAEWVEDTHNDRHGRVLVTTFRIASPVTEGPFTFMPYSVVSGDGGVRGITTIIEQHAGSTAQETVGIIIAPPV